MSKWQYKFDGLNEFEDVDQGLLNNLLRISPEEVAEAVLESWAEEDSDFYRVIQEGFDMEVKDPSGKVTIVAVCGESQFVIYANEKEPSDE